MRYFIVNYRKVMQGKGHRATMQTDETVSVSKKIKTRDLQTASVILDFVTKQVVQCQMDGKVADKDWDRVRNFYYQYYKKIIDDLETSNSKVAAPEPIVSDKDPV